MRGDERGVSVQDKKCVSYGELNIEDRLHYQLLRTHEVSCVLFCSLSPKIQQCHFCSLATVLVATN